MRPTMSIENAIHGLSATPEAVLCTRATAGCSHGSRMSSGGSAWVEMARVEDAPSGDILRHGYRGILKVHVS